MSHPIENFILLGFVKIKRYTFVIVICTQIWAQFIALSAATAYSHMFWQSIRLHDRLWRGLEFFEETEIAIVLD